MRPDWSPKYRTSFEYIMNSFVLPKLGSLLIGSIDNVMVQTVINVLAHYSRSTLKHVREKMFSVFSQAVVQKFVSENPVSKIKLATTAQKAVPNGFKKTRVVHPTDRWTDRRKGQSDLLGWHLLRPANQRGIRAVLEELLPRTGRRELLHGRAGRLRWRRPRGNHQDRSQPCSGAYGLMLASISADATYFESLMVGEA